MLFLEDSTNFEVVELSQILGPEDFHLLKTGVGKFLFGRSLLFTCVLNRANRLDM